MSALEMLWNSGGGGDEEEEDLREEDLQEEEEETCVHRDEEPMKKKKKRSRKRRRSLPLSLSTVSRKKPCLAGGEETPPPPPTSAAAAGGTKSNKQRSPPSKIHPSVVEAHVRSARNHILTLEDPPPPPPPPPPVATNHPRPSTRPELPRSASLKATTAAAAVSPPGVVPERREGEGEATAPAPRPPGFYRPARPEIHVPPRGIGPVEVPNCNDVLTGMGPSIYKHEGNRQFRDVVARRWRAGDYSASLNRAAVAADVVRQIRNMEPPGRFLKENEEDATWYDVGDEEAIRKAMQTFREFRRQRNAQKGQPEQDNCGGDERKKKKKKKGKGTWNSSLTTTVPPLYRTQSAPVAVAAAPPLPPSLYSHTSAPVVTNKKLPPPASPGPHVMKHEISNETDVVLKKAGYAGSAFESVMNDWWKRYDEARHHLKMPLVKKVHQDLQKRNVRFLLQDAVRNDVFVETVDEEAIYARIMKSLRRKANAMVGGKKRRRGCGKAKEEKEEENDVYCSPMSGNKVSSAEQQQEQEEGVFAFEEILDHTGPLTPGSKDYKGCSYNLRILWSDGSKTWEPVSLIAESDPVSVAAYGKQNGLLDQTGWTRFKRIIAAEEDEQEDEETVSSEKEQDDGDDDETLSSGKEENDDDESVFSKKKNEEKDDTDASSAPSMPPASVAFYGVPVAPHQPSTSVPYQYPYALPHPYHLVPYPHLYSQHPGNGDQQKGKNALEKNHHEGESVSERTSGKTDASASSTKLPAAFAVYGALFPGDNEDQNDEERLSEENHKNDGASSSKPPASAKPSGVPSNLLRKESLSHETDVILGKAFPCNLFEHFIDVYWEEYDKTPDHEKKVVISSVYSGLKEQGCRFFEEYKPGDKAYKDYFKEVTDFDNRIRVRIARTLRRMANEKLMETVMETGETVKSKDRAGMVSKAQDEENMSEGSCQKTKGDASPEEPGGPQQPPLIHRDDLSLQTDVVLGFAGFAGTLFHDAMEMYWEEYNRTPTFKKGGIVTAVYKKLKEQGCRFLEECKSDTKAQKNNLFREVTDFDDRIRQRITRTLRRRANKKLEEENWSEGLEELRTYKKRIGNCNVPLNYHANPKLALWVSDIRCKKKNRELDGVKIKILEELGFSWNEEAADLHSNRCGGKNLPVAHPPQNANRPPPNAMVPLAQSLLMLQHQQPSLSEPPRKPAVPLRHGNWPPPTPTVTNEATTLPLTMARGPRVVSDLHVNDIVVGGTLRHPGCMGEAVLRAAFGELRQAYEAATAPEEKFRIVELVVQAVRNQNPPGRFLARLSGPLRFEELPHYAACHALQTMIECGQIPTDRCHYQPVILNPGIALFHHHHQTGQPSQKSGTVLYAGATGGDKQPSSIEEEQQGGDAEAAPAGSKVQGRQD